MTASLFEEGNSGVTGYEGAPNYSEYNAGTGGSRRRKRGRKNSKKRSRRRSRRSRRGMKKMFRGGNKDPGPTVAEDEAGETEDTEETNDDTVATGGTVATGDTVSPETSGAQGPLPVGGKRRHKKAHKGKTRKGKVSKWITHVKNFSRANKMDFRDALKDPKCKATYHKMK